MMGARSHFQNNRRLTQKERRYGMLRWGGGTEDVIMGDIDAVVGDGRLELREATIEMVRKQEKNEERKVLMAVAIMGELISDQCQVNLRKIKTRTQLLKWQF